MRLSPRSLGLAALVLLSVAAAGAGTGVGAIAPTASAPYPRAPVPCSDANTTFHPMCVSASPAPSPTPASGLLTDLVSYYKMDEASGTRADSVTASANDLTDNNTVGTAAGIVGTSALFVRADSEWLSKTDNASLSTGDIDFTFACWVYLVSKPVTGGVGVGLIGQWNVTGSNREHLIYWDETLDRFLFVVSADGIASAFVKADSLGAPATATWYLVVGWHDASANTINIQVNNGTVDSVSHTTGVKDGSGPLILGAYGGSTPVFGTYLNGRLDEVAFWKRVLTATERTNLYSGGSGVTYPFTGVP